MRKTSAANKMRILMLHKHLTHPLFSLMYNVHTYMVLVGIRYSYSFKFEITSIILSTEQL